MKALVTVGAGFIGAHLVEALVAAGEELAVDFQMFWFSKPGYHRSRPL
jgi:UDP-glucose 4-epimerase